MTDPVTQSTPAQAAPVKSAPITRPAATLILIRDREGAPPELLMLERSGSMRFAASALVFPGGAVDPGDRTLAETSGLADTEEAAARIAAIRETLEESGIAIGLTPEPDAETRARLRAGIEAGEDFGAMLAEAGLTLDLSQLVPFARWCPKRDDGIPTFDARFFLARAPDGQEASVDETENVSLIWGNVAQMLASDYRIIFPTHRNLDRLAQFASYDEACAHSAQHPVQMITPWIEERDGEPHLCIPEGLGYPVTSQSMRTVKRG